MRIDSVWFCGRALRFAVLAVMLCFCAAVGFGSKRRSKRHFSPKVKDGCADGCLYQKPGAWCNPEVDDPKHRCDQYPFSPDPEFDCKLRQFQFDFANETLLHSDDAPARRSLFDALELATRCNRPEPAGLAPPPTASGFRPSIRGIGQPHACQRSTRTLYVDAMLGDDDAGTGDFLKPFKSPWRAREAVRAVPRSRREATCVVFAGGTYELSETLRFSVEDGGRDSEHPVIYTAAEGQRVTFSGGREIKPKWKKYPGRAGVLEAAVPEELGWGSPSLFVQGRRQVLARWPNANPEYQAWPFGYSTSDEWWDGTTPEPTDGFDARFAGTADTPYLRNWTDFHTVGKIMGGTNANRYSPAVCFDEYDITQHWTSDGVCGSLAYGMGMDADKWIHTTPINTTSLRAHTMQAQPGWGNWMFDIDAIYTSDSASGKRVNVSFSRGGWQTAASDQGGAFDFFIEGALELLDAPGEFYHAKGKVFLYPNGSVPDAITIPTIRELISIEGTQRSPVSNILFDSITFAHTTPTFMEKYAVPGPGDWSIRTSGAVYVEGAENITIQRSLFDSVGGNAVFFHGYARWSSLLQNEVRYPGDSAFAAVGRTELVDATGGDFPQDLLIEGNHLHELGVFGKQTTGWFQSVSAHNTIRKNIIYNGPRSGVNWNDGMGGGNLLEGNMMFNLVRESSDHGPVNSWDRAPYISNRGATPGKPGVVPAKTEERFNLISTARGRGFSTLDHDDGSSFYYDHHNVLLYGGNQNYHGGNNSMISNLIIEPNTQMYGPGAYSCENADSSQLGLVYMNNTCVNNNTVEPNRLLFAGEKKFLPRTEGNAYLCGKASEQKEWAQEQLFGCWAGEYVGSAASKGPSWCSPKNGSANYAFTLKEWQAHGQEIGSVMGPMPRHKDILAAAWEMLSPMGLN